MALPYWSIYPRSPRCRRLAGTFTPVCVAAAGVGIGALCLVPVTAARGVVLTYSAAGWALLFYLGLASTALAYARFSAGLRRMPATSAATMRLPEPLLASGLAWVPFGERLAVWLLLVRPTAVVSAGSAVG